MGNEALRFRDRTHRGRLAALVVAGIAGAALGAPAYAQEGVETVVVTARKRAEDLQQVPLAVEAITGEKIENRGLVSLDDITRQTSSVIFQQGFSPQDTKITIRGLSPDRGRVNVAVLLDGIDITGESIQTVGGSLLINPELFDLERVEIVKGPQNALYGRSAYNGAISYVTRKPSETFEGTIGTDVGSDGQLKGSARVSGPIVGDTLLGSLTGMAYSHDGFYRNGVTGAEVGGKEGWGTAGTLLWQARDNLTVTGRLSHSDDEYEPQPWAFMNPNRQFAIPASAISDGVVSGCSDADAANFGLFGDGSWPTPTTNCVEPISATAPSTSNGGDVAGLLGIPGLLPYVQGFIPGAAGVFPDAGALGNRATLSEDPHTCTDPNDRTTCRDFEGAAVEVTRATLDVQWDLGAVALTSLTHLASSEASQYQDSNNTGSVFDLPFIAQGRWETDTDLFSQELRLQSTGDNVVDWTVGALYWDESVDQDDFGSSCIAVYHPLAPDPGGTPARPNLPCGPIMANIGPNGIYPFAHEMWFRDTEHLSAYFLVDWKFMENWDIAFEGRFVDEELDVGGPNGDTTIDPYGIGLNSVTTGCVQYDPDGAGPLDPFNRSCVNPLPLVAPFFITDEDFPEIDEDEDSYFVPKVTLSWRPTDDMTMYASWAKAAKPSGISALTGGPGSFNPVANAFQREERDVYEIGAKTRWLDRRLTINGAFFYDDYSGKQVSTQITLPGGLIAPRTVNGGNAEVMGIELEVAAQITDNLFASLGYTWLDTEWKKYVQNTRSAIQIAYGGNCTIEIVATPDQTSPETSDPDPNNTDPEPRTNCLVDLSGNELTYAPEHSLVGNIAYQRELAGDMDWLVEADFQYQDQRFVNDSNTLALDSYWIANMRAGINGRRWSALVYVDNVFDDDTIRSGLDNIDVRYLGTAGLPNGARGLLPDPRSYGLRVSYRFGENQ